jgi:hypothetical protein
MGDTDHKKLGSRRRKLLTQRLREYFEELRADLEGDSEAFFRNVMAQAERTPDKPHAPQHRRG